MIGKRTWIAVLIASCVLGYATHADVIVLSSGETLHGSVVEESDKVIVIEHAILGRLVIQRDQITSITTESGEAGDAGNGSGEVVAEKKTTEEVKAITESAPDESAWKSHFAAGAGFQSGNTENAELSLEFTTKRESAKSRDTVDARYYYGQERGDRNANKFTSGIVHEWLFADSPWSVFADGRFDYDEFNSWEYRLSGHGGAGYQLIEEDDLNVILRAGFGGAKEFKSSRNQIIPEALVGGELAWTISDRQQFKIESTLYPDLDDTGEFRDITSASWDYKLNDEGNTAFTLGLYNEYQSKTDPGISKNDIRIFGGLSFDF